MEDENSIKGYYSYIIGNFLKKIIDILLERRVLTSKRRVDDFADDKDFIRYLKANNLYLLLGSQYIFKNRDYKIDDEYKRLLDDFDTIYTVVLSDGIALKRNAMQVCLHDIDVSIHPLKIENYNDNEIEYNKESGKYLYSISKGLPIDFDENELKEFLYNNHKVINITAKISIQVNDNLCGTIFT